MVRSRGADPPATAGTEDGGGGGGDLDSPAAPSTSAASASTTPIFVNGLASSPAERRRPAKLFHKKSRTGCQRCRARRVKCDEAKPVCSHCTRLGLGCVYDRTAKPPPPPPTSHSDQGESSSPGNASITPSDHDHHHHSSVDKALRTLGGDPPESEARRKLEVELFYQYCSETGPSIPVDEISRPLWVTVICNLAFKSDAVLYSVYLLAALHRAKKSNFADEDYVAHCHTYLNLALREHHKDLAQLSAANLDYICLASNILRIYGFIRLQDRPLEPYEPPIDWLQITGASNAVFRQAPKIAEEHPEAAASVGMRMIAMVNHILAEDAARAHRNEFLHLLRRDRPHELAEPWDDETEDAYRATVNYIAGIWKALDPQDPPRSIGRRLIVFPMLMNNRFVALLEERRPRALVILAHYFALLDKLRSFWWIGDIGAREVRAIAETVPPEWQGLLSFPLHVLDGHGHGQGVILPEASFGS